MANTGWADSLKSALKRVRESTHKSGFAFIGEYLMEIYFFNDILWGDALEIKYLTHIDCELQRVGDEFGKKPLALAVQNGSLLVDRLNDAYV